MLQKRDLTILASVWFIIALATLVLNDFVLKAYYHNWLTGKLSDFAGIFVFALFWTALLPKHKRVIFGLTAVFFVFWKSPYSQFLIDAWNGLGAFRIGRVVDATDLVALAVLPLAYVYHARGEHVRTIKLTPVLPLVLSALSFIGTTCFYSVPVNKEYLFTISRDSLITQLSHLPSVGMHMDSVHDARSIDIWVDDTTMECHGGYRALCELTGDTNGSQLKVIEIKHRCYSSSDVGATLTNSFERMVITALQGL